jgi:hypothetical protein
MRPLANLNLIASWPQKRRSLSNSSINPTSAISQLHIPSHIKSEQSMKERNRSEVLGMGRYKLTGYFFLLLVDKGFVSSGARADGFVGGGEEDDGEEGESEA